MAFNIDIIKEKWLVSGAIPYSEEVVVSAFNEVELILGQDWLNNIKFQNGVESFGPIITIHIVEIGIQLALLKKGANHEALIAKLLSQNSKEKEKAIAELNAVALICTNESELEFELEPKVSKRNSTASLPDFRVKKNTDIDWTYIEVKQPDVSKENKAVRVIFHTLQKLLNQNIDFLTLEILLEHVPTELEIDLLYNECNNILKAHFTGEKNLEGLGTIKINYNQPQEYIVESPEELKEKPMLYYVSNIIMDSIPIKLIAIGISVSDERAWRFLKDASDQLCSTSPGILFLDGGNVPKRSFKNWSIILSKQIKEKPDLNKIFSGIVSYSGYTENKPNSGVMITTAIKDVSIIINETATYQVPSWIIDKLKLYS